MNTQTRAILMFSGTTLGIIGTAYVPQEKVKPSKEFINQNYITSKNIFGRTIELIDDNKSEERKQILLAIRNDRERMEKMQKHLDEIATYRRSGKLITTILSTIEQKSKIRISSIVYNKAKEIGVPKRLLSAEQIAKRKGIVVINEFEI